jgi:hypothetical protein
MKLVKLNARTTTTASATEQRKAQQVALSAATRSENYLY